MFVMLVRSDQTSILPQASSNQDSWVPYSFFFTLSYVTYSVSIYHMSDGAVSFASKYQQKVGLNVVLELQWGLQTPLQKYATLERYQTT